MARDGVGYERQVGANLVSAGFDVRFTPASGDLGVDLLAERGERQWMSLEAKLVGPASEGRWLTLRESTNKCTDSHR